jgi:uncharacterized protein YggU (UPF0235/DUF167 family)
MTDFYVKVKTEADSFRIEQGDILKVYLTEPAENGRANAQLVRNLTSILGEKPAIVSGHKSSRKKLRADISEEELDTEIEKADS